MLDDGGQCDHLSYALSPSVDSLDDVDDMALDESVNMLSYHEYLPDFTNHSQGVDDDSVRTLAD